LSVEPFGQDFARYFISIMDDISKYSGPWTGWSIQDGVRISESLHLVFDGGSISGSGCDKDGDFQIDGHYNSRTNSVRVTRRYTWTTNLEQEGVGIPYEYNGRWDGMAVAGTWNPRAYPLYGGPFEMWPDTGEESMEYSLEALGVSSFAGVGE